jgi:hypothetical protein
MAVVSYGNTSLEAQRAINSARNRRIRIAR